MAAVRINSGPVEARDKLREVPRDKWHDLMLARRQYMEIHINSDCRCLVEFCNDAETMHTACGFASAEDMIRKGYGLQPDEVALAIEWLRLNPSEHNPVPLQHAVTLAKHGINQHTVGVDNIKSSVSKTTGGGTSRAYILARLDRDGHAGLAAKVRSGELSANAAAIEAGFRKKPAPIEQARKALAKLSDIAWEKLKRDEDERRRKSSSDAAA